MSQPPYFNASSAYVTEMQPFYGQTPSASATRKISSATEGAMRANARQDARYHNSMTKLPIVVDIPFEQAKMSSSTGVRIARLSVQPKPKPLIWESQQKKLPEGAPIKQATWQETQARLDNIILDIETKYPTADGSYPDEYDEDTNLLLDSHLDAMLHLAFVDYARGQATECLNKLQQLDKYCFYMSGDQYIKYKNIGNENNRSLLTAKQ